MNKTFCFSLVYLPLMNCTCSSSCNDILEVTQIESEGIETRLEDKPKNLHVTPWGAKRFVRDSCKAIGGLRKIPKHLHSPQGKEELSSSVLIQECRSGAQLKMNTSFLKLTKKLFSKRDYHQCCELFN